MYDKVVAITNDYILPTGTYYIQHHIYWIHGIYTPFEPGMYIHITGFATGIITDMQCIYCVLKQNWMEQYFLNQQLVKIKQKLKFVRRGVYVCICASV